MKKKIIIANWKMKLSGPAAQELIREFIDIYQPTEKAEVVICPDYLNLPLISQAIKDTEIALGAQNCFWEKTGAFTGEISPKFLKEAGARYVIVGHSERRTYLGETNEMVNNKVKAALAEGLAPIVCVGETFEERQEGNKDFVIINQVNKAVADVKLNEGDELIIAYEPVWVIGSGQAVAPEEAEHTHRVIRQVLMDNFEIDVIDEKIRLIYGGSIEPANLKGFLTMPNIDGALVGGASLDPIAFNDLLKEVS